MHLIWSYRDSYRERYISCLLYTTYEEKTVTVTLGKKSDFSDVTTDNSSDSSNDSNNNSNNGNNNGNSNGNSGNSNGNSGDYGYGNGNFGNDNGNGYINPYEYFFGNNY